MLTVVAPGSSANLGPGFDVLGVAIDRHAWVSTEPDSDPLGRGEHTSEPCPDGHLARVAFEKAGGAGPIWFGHDLFPGRGLGFSAAARAAGAVAGGLSAGRDLASARAAAYPLVADLEGHHDNAAPAVFGGLQIAVGHARHAVTARLPGALWCWVPDSQTSTDASRAVLGAEVALADAVENLGRVALLMAALYEGRPDLLREATVDRLHQAKRFASQPISALVLESALEAGATCGWLSGSGPSVALVGPGAVPTADGSAAAVASPEAPAFIDAVEKVAPAGSRLLRVGVDDLGARSL